ncbi:hypothetical protein Asp14428_14140 [Actinoplanes sp. NBRC 14428]|nr:hypothetical protein Asp14428_14140 [Actinoplanes sp. NBRC 14428]
MLSVLVRRVRSQWALLGTLLMLVTVGATLAGTCALLVTRTGGQALEVVASRADPADVKVTAYTADIGAKAAASVAAETRDDLVSALAPLPATTTTRASSRMRSLPARSGASGTTAETYLSGISDLPAHAVLAAGRWPRAAAVPEAVVLESTAKVLGLSPGDTVRLGPERAFDPSPALTVTVVGVARPLPATGWDRDPLYGAGYDGAFENGQPAPVRAYGPFLVDLDVLLAGTSAIDRLEVTAHPGLARATRSELDAVSATLAGADRRLGGTLGDRVKFYRVDARLPVTLDAARAQQEVAAAVVLAVAVLGCALCATALVLAGRLTAGVRAGETALLAALGLSRGQLAAIAVGEAAVLAVLGAALAAPASAALHAGLTHLPPLSGAGLAVDPAVNAPQLIVVALSALGLAAVLAALAVRRGATGGGRRRAEVLARSGADLLLVAFAAAGWWQLHGQTAGATGRTDAVRVTAPALVLTAGAAVLLRVVPPALRGLDRVARRSRGLTFPLAAFEAARRPHAVAAGLLVALACAAGTFGVAFDATWQRAQHDQADLAVGTDLTVAASGTPRAGDTAAIAAATGGEVSPATDRGVPIGQWVGRAGDPPRLIATDTRRAGPLLRGRLDDGRTWAGVGAALAPAERVTGVGVPAGAALTLRGTATGDVPIAVTPRLLLQDGWGMRTSCIARSVPLDGATHRVRGCTPGAGLSLIAVALPVAPAGGGPSGGEIAVAATLTVPAGRPGASWTASSAPPAAGQLSRPAVTVTGTPAGTRLAMTADVKLSGPDEAARTLVATAFRDPGRVPVAVSARLADDLGIGPGAQLSVPVGVTPVPVTVAQVLPAVPAAPTAPAMLADVDALTRAMAVRGDLEFPLDAWWVGKPAYADAAARTTALRLGTVTTRAGETGRLLESPPRAGVAPAVRLLVLAAALLLLAGIVLHVTADLRLRAVEVARLRGLGVTRRQVRVALLGQHAGVLLPVVLAGAVVGWLATRLVTPHMIRSETGARPVPGVVPQWPWAAETALTALFLAACVLTVGAVVVAQTRRADAAHLRVTS